MTEILVYTLQIPFAICNLIFNVLSLTGSHQSLFRLSLVCPFLEMTLVPQTGEPMIVFRAEGRLPFLRTDPKGRPVRKCSASVLANWQLSLVKLTQPWKDTFGHAQHSQLARTNASHRMPFENICRVFRKLIVQLFCRVAQGYLANILWHGQVWTEVKRRR